MKLKNLVSLSVSAAFAVLSITGMLIYLGQGNHTIDHTHAWFGVLFVGAAVFHIVNNWSSIKGYSVNRRAGGVRRELILPSLLALLFVTGIAFDWPVFKDLANAGKRAFGPKKEKKQELTQTVIDSISRSNLASRMAVDAQTIRFDTTAALADNVIMAQGTARRPQPDTSTVRFTQVLTLKDKVWNIAAEQTAPVRP